MPYLALLIAIYFLVGFLGDQERNLRGPCVESTPQAALLDLPAARPPDAPPSGSSPPPGESVPFGEPTIERTSENPRLVRLALAYEPVLEVAKADRFWPVPFPVVLALSMGDERRTRFFGAEGDPHDAELADLRADGVTTDYIDYPAALERVQDEFCSVGRALGVAAGDLARWSTSPDLLHPERSAQFYLLARDHDGGGLDLQYWFFYPYNYLPVLTLNPFFMGDPLGATLAAADFHEGDFEHVTVRLRPDGDDGLRPVAVEMARHANEDRTLRWSSPELERRGTHPVVYAGFGGHASYEGCGRKVRRIGPLVRLLDWALCDPAKVFTLPADTPLVDLRAVPWACWPGHFGEVPRRPLRELRVAGPASPLFQAGNARAAICAGRG